MKRFRAAAVIALGLTVIAACGTGDENGNSVSPTTRPAEQPGPVVDWVTHASVDLGGGWSIRDTDGDGPLLTVVRNGEVVGLLEYLDFPVENAKDDDRATLDAHVAAYVRDIGSDRANTPIDGYRFVPDQAVHLEAADGAIVRYGFRATLPDGRPSERTIQWAGIRDGRLVLVSAAANDPGGLFPPEGTEFTSAQLDEVADRLDRMVRVSGLPRPSTT